MLNAINHVSPGHCWLVLISMSLPTEFRGEHADVENPVFELDMKVYVACSFVDEWRARICALGKSILSKGANLHACQVR